VVRGLVDDRVKAVTEDGAGRVWVVCEKGVSVFDPVAERWTTVLGARGETPVSGTVPESPEFRSVVVADDGSIWFGGEDAICGLRPRSVGPKGE
jgi:sugar lactone lactonase YvrE